MTTALARPAALTAPAARARSARADRGAVTTRRELYAEGWTKAQIAAQLRAHRWQTLGSAIVLHNGSPSRSDREAAYLRNCGPRSFLTSFSAITHWGLAGWERDDVHVLVPAGTRRPASLRGLVLHRVVAWDPSAVVESRRLHRLAPALLVAAGSVSSSRVACALLAAAVQQRLLRAAELHRALDRQPKLRHAHDLRLALHDIEQGSQALSEIDFVRLCRRHRLPEPIRQAIRVEPDGRRRYLDAGWRLRNGRLVAVEVDGAIHLAPDSWVRDQLRQNEVVISGVPVLRFPTVIVRTDGATVADQLRRLFVAHGGL